MRKTAFGFPSALAGGNYPSSMEQKSSMIGLKRLLPILLGSLGLLIAVSLAAAQTHVIAQTTVPFEFWIEGSHLPAGEYRIEHIETTAYILFRSTDGKIAHDAYTVPLDDSPVSEADSKLIFRIQDAKHYLYEGCGTYGKRVVTGEAWRPQPAGENRVEVPIVYP